MSTGPIKFAEFELDRPRYELRRHGKTLKLEKIPMELLLLLVTKNGDLVTRQEIEAHLWGNEVFVDAEHGINTAVRKVRHALGDDPDRPRFVQTVQRKGYRFIAEIVDVQEEAASATSLAGSNGLPPPVQPDRVAPKEATTADEAASLANRTKLLFWSVGLAAVVLFAGMAVKFLPRLIHRDPVTSPIRSIAVLPLENLSGDPGQEYFADGMTDELITMLAKYQPLRVISRTSVMQYKKAHRPLPEIARELGVDGIVEGSISRSKDRVHVNAQLVYAPTDTHLWAESYDRDLGDVLSLQETLARGIAEHVHAASSLRENPGTSAHTTTNPAARDAYFRGRYHWFSDQYKKSREFFEEAIQLDPQYAAAYTGLSDSYLAAAVVGELRPGEGGPKGELAAQKALELDDSLAEAHHSMAAAKLFFRWDWAAAEKEIERAIELNPNLAESRHLHGYILNAVNRQEEALQEEKVSIELNPFQRSWSYGHALIGARRYDDAVSELKQRIAARPESPMLHLMLSAAYEYSGNSQEAFAEARKSLVLWGDQEAVSAADRAFLKGGYQAVKEDDLQRLKQRATQRYVSAERLAELAAQAGRLEEAMQDLLKAFELRDPRLIFLQHTPEFDSLHSDPRYWQLVKRMNMPPLQ